jgi:hypothetical protein
VFQVTVWRREVRRHTLTKRHKDLEADLADLDDNVVTIGGAPNSSTWAHPGKLLGAGSRAQTQWCWLTVESPRYFLS